MNVPAPAVLKDELLKQLGNQEEKYASATTVIERLANARSSTDPAHQKDLILLQKLLAEIRTAAAQVDAARSAFEADGSPTSPEMKQTIQQHAAKLANFLTQVDGLQSAFTSGRDSLQTELDTQATRRSMHTAYRQSMKTG